MGKRADAGSPGALPAPPASRLRAPSWLDGRLIAGLLLIMICVVVGAKLLASSDHYDQVWAASRDVAAGVTLTKADIERVEVRFHDHGEGYFAVDRGTLAGRVTSVPLTSGQLIPIGAVASGASQPVRLVTVPVSRLHMPKGSDLQGQQIDLYVTPRSDGQQSTSQPRLVLAGVTVADTINDSSGLAGSDGSGVVLAVPLRYVDDVVAAVEQGAVDLVKVPTEQTAAQPSPGAAASP